MIPPETADTGDGNATTGTAPPAVSVCLTVLTKRADFLRAARARHQATTGMMVQGRKRADDEAAGIRVGFTCSKKLGNAVARNRAKRRLREVARLVLPDLGQAGWDYVLIGRRDATAERPFEALQDDLGCALKKLHQNQGRV